MDNLTLPNLFTARTLAAPGKPFLRMGAVTYTYAAFQAAAGELACGLSEKLDIHIGSILPTLMPNCPESVLALFSVAQLGGTWAPIDANLRGAGLAHALNLTQADTIIVDDGCLDALFAVAPAVPRIRKIAVRGSVPSGAPAGWSLISFDDLPCAATATPAAAAAVRESDPLMLLYTSGTTGRSKACVLSHRYAIRQAQIAAREWGLRQDDVMYCPFPLYHADAAVWTIVSAAALGATAAIGRRFSVSRFWPEIREFDATVFDYMGATLTLLHKQPRQKDDPSNPARLAWGVPRPAIAAEFEQRFAVTVVDTYGLTEGGLVAYRSPGMQIPDSSCGRVIPEYDVRIFNEDDTEVTAGEVGQIVLRPLEPDLTMNGYLRMPEQTLKLTHNLWLHTGDLGRKDSSGNLYFEGRLKDSIRRRGENISAREIEEALSAHPAILEVAAYGVPSELTEDEVAVAVVLRQNSTLTAQEVRDYCRPRMARQMVPEHVFFLAELPKTPTEKVQKSVLREAFVTSATTVSTQQEPA